MEANELRIGNLIMVDGFIEIIKSINEIGINIFLDDGIIIEYAEFYELEPIKLTEEILLKCGFIPCSIIDNHFNISGMCIWKCNDMFLCDKNGVHIKYLHQLQNLYWCLTNEELTIKL